jgi:hypothetical protein
MQFLPMGSKYSLFTFNLESAFEYSYLTLTSWYKVFTFEPLGMKVLLKHAFMHDRGKKGGQFV